ncbi:MAG: patatin-like phospholipase family protein [Flavobacteriales bacterium]|nr:patatin-like phospholipase family protein [Flavobacteriales bacterium]
MVYKATFRQRSRRLLYFFPFQLFVLHLKKNHLLLLVWLVLFGFITQGMGMKYGVPYLFLTPEYFGASTFWSFGILGFAVGGFFTAYNLYSYTTHAYRFPFIATISRPFLKFSINNSLLPLLFVLTYLICSARLQFTKELVPVPHIIINLIGFLSGIVLFMAVSMIYFFRTNTDVHKLLGPDAAEHRAPEPMEDILPFGPPAQQRHELRKATRWLRREQRTRKWKVELYMTSPWRVALARSSAHYDKLLLRSVLWQNHINGSIFSIVLVVAFVALGAFSGSPVFAIPAGASVFMLFTIVLMLLSAMYSWLKGWTIALLIGVVLALNLLSLKTDAFLSDAQAYGMDYSGTPATYDRIAIHDLACDTASARKDAERFTETLDHWLGHNQRLPNANAKPKLLIVNTSGGGSRAMVWTFRSLQVADSLLGGGLMQRTALMTGSSGGLIGAAYFREVEAGQREGGPQRVQDPAHLDAMSSDILNPLGFSFVTNDMFIRYRRVHDGMRSYTLDRGFAFEQRINELTDSLLDMRFSDFAEAEQRAEIPLLVISPASLNDGRRLIMSAQPVAFLTNIAAQGRINTANEPESIEFGKLFAAQDAQRIKLTSALRMSASFPYITPVVSLPSEPRMRVMDAGVRDNYGYRTTAMFLFTFREWIARNTSGVVILQMRDKQRELEVKPVNSSLVGRLLDPVGSVYDNFVKSQDQDYDLMMKQAEAWCAFPVDLVDLSLRHDDDDEISLSWHLTAIEKRQVLQTISSPDNQTAFARLRELVLGSTPLVSAHVPPGTATDPEAATVERR